MAACLVDDRIENIPGSRMDSVVDEGFDKFGCRLVRSIGKIPIELGMVDRSLKEKLSMQSRCEWHESYSVILELSGWELEVDTV